MGETRDGYLVCRNAVIARTGFHTYYAREMEPEHLQREGVTVTSPDDELELYRSPDDLFSPECMASWESLPVTDNHPYKFVDITTHSTLSKGHVRNVRRGDEPLSDGNYPLLADLIITDSTLRQAIESKSKRELSGGYTYDLKMIDGVLSYTQTRGNHVAVVDKARAGRLVKVYDSIDGNKGARMKNWLGEMFKAWSVTATPEQVGEALTLARANDAEPEPKKELAKTVAKDADDDFESKMHAALDKVLAKRDEANAAMDEDMSTLKGLFSGAAEDADPDDDDEDEKKKKKGEAEDGSAGFVNDNDPDGELEGDEKPKEDKSTATDSISFLMGQKAALKALKPFVARADNKALTKAFDTAQKLVSAGTKTVKAGIGYQGVVKASQTRELSRTTDSGKHLKDPAYDAYMSALAERAKGRN